jgi:predicted nucleic acid-binding protein
LIRRIDEGEFRVNISVALALEYEEILKRTDLIPGFSETDIDTFLDYMFQASNLVPSVAPLRPNLPDPDDELVLDLAVQRHAIILTYNKRDFGEAEKLGVRVLSPAEFLGILRQEI